MSEDQTLFRQLEISLRSRATQSNWLFLEPVEDSVRKAVSENISEICDPFFVQLYMEKQDTYRDNMLVQPYPEYMSMYSPKFTPIEIAKQIYDELDLIEADFDIIRG